MIEDMDMTVLKKMRTLAKKKKSSFKSRINSRELSDDELDELFLSD